MRHNEQELKMESEVCFNQTNKRVESGKQSNREEERAGGGLIHLDGFGESLFISCLKIEPKLRNFQVGLKYPKCKLDMFFFSILPNDGDDDLS